MKYLNKSFNFFPNRSKEYDKNYDLIFRKERKKDDEDNKEDRNLQSN